MAVTRMRFTGSGTGKSYIDLAKAISLQERRLHRQKKIYTVYGGYFVDGSQDAGVVSRVNLNVAPNTWTARTAVNRAFRIWKRMISETLKNSEGVKPGKYNDFKLFLNNAMGSTPLLPKDAEGNNLYTTNAPEWDYSTLTSADPAHRGDGVQLAADQFELKIVGQRAGAVHADGNDGWTRIGVIDSWVDSRPAISSVANPTATPDASGDPLANLFDTGDTDDDRITIIEAEGDQAPYDEATMFGMASSTETGAHNLQRASVATSTKEMPVAPVHGFQALCGLVQVDVSSVDGDWELVLDVETVGDEF